MIVSPLAEVAKPADPNAGLWFPFDEGCSCCGVLLYPRAFAVGRSGRRNTYTCGQARS